MATQAHCAYCFDCLAASFERRQPLSLAQVEQLWDQYHTSKPAGTNSGSGGVGNKAKGRDEDVADDEEEKNDDDDDAEMVDAETDEPAARPAAISRLLNRDSASSSSSSLPSNASSSRNASGSLTPASSMSSHSSLFSFATRRQPASYADFPLFVTWNTISRNGHKTLRGCIGTFEPQELGYGLRSYALTSAFEDARFQPIPASLLSSLSCHVTLLTNFSSPGRDPLDWTLGKHGLRISFTSHGRRHGSTYLPDVAREQGWTKEETLISLMRKAGWNGSSSGWQKVWKDGKGELITYEGKQIALHYPEWRQWREWVEKQGVGKKALN